MYLRTHGAFLLHTSTTARSIKSSRIRYRSLLGVDFLPISYSSAIVVIAKKRGRKSYRSAPRTNAALGYQDKRILVMKRRSYCCQGQCRLFFATHLPAFVPNRCWRTWPERPLPRTPGNRGRPAVAAKKAKNNLKKASEGKDGLKLDYDN